MATTNRAVGGGGISHPPIYEPGPNGTWMECIWSPSQNHYVCYEIAASKLPEHMKAPRKQFVQAGGSSQK
jgi:hypothetical protein